jgi:hypothetical protein
MTFIPYQIDYNVKNTAKTLGFSKKKVIFKFGIANPDSIQQGMTGAHCRGSEHELVFLWSLKTGKRQLLLDNKDVHFSESGQNGWTTDRAWQHVFQVRDATTGGTFRCHFISQPVNKEVPGSRPFDLRVSGVSYFSFNQIFQLGTAAMTAREQARSPSGEDPQYHHTGRDSPVSREEQRSIALAKAESLRDMAEQRNNRDRASTQTSSMSRNEGSLISFDDPTPPQAITAGQGQASYQQFASSLTLDTAIDDKRQGQYGQGAPSSAGSGGSGWNQPMPAAYGQPPPQGNPNPNSMALTTYQAPGGQPAPYVDSAGRMAMGQQPGYGYNPGMQQQQQMQQQQPLMSPSAMSYNSQASYGSAPSFAQPPRAPVTVASPPPQQQQQQPMYASGYPPQQHQQQPQYSQAASSGYGPPPSLPQQGSFGSHTPSYGSGSYPPAPAQGYPSQSYNPNQPAY